MISRSFFALIIVGSATIAENASAQAVTWNADKTLIAGSGCRKDIDAFVATSGNDFAVVFTRFGVDLPGGIGTQLGDLKNCTVRVPAAIAKGLYIAQLTQRLTYGINKTAASSGAIATLSTFFGFNVSPFTLTVPYGGALSQPLLTESRVDQFLTNTSWYQGWCNDTRSVNGLYQANLAVSGRRDNANESLILSTHGLDLKYEILTDISECK